MTVTFPKGFTAAGLAAGLKSTGKRDLALVYNTAKHPRSAVVFTSNRSQANPILWSKQIQTDRACAVILNSGGANCFTGAYGYETSRLTAERVAAAVGAGASEVFVCSTGLIGTGGESFRTSILEAIPALCASLGDTERDGVAAAEAIMTTDTVAKTAQFEHANGWKIGAMAKGAGMLAPALATMLVVITTDADVSSDTLQRSLEYATARTFNRLDSDGCTSTNDQVTLLANAESGCTPTEQEFTDALTEVCADLARQLMEDAEGASHCIEIRVTGARTEEDAVIVGRSLARNNLFKTAMFGNDANWGRVLAAIGTTNADFDPYKVSVSFNRVRLCHEGAPDRPVEECDLSGRNVEVLIELHNGEHEASILTNDLTHDYVHENSAYSS